MKEVAMNGISAIEHVDHVGSLVRPAELIQAWKAQEADEISQQELTDLTDGLIKEVVRFQEGLGLQVVTDGEFRRGAWSAGFTAAVDGFERIPAGLIFRDGSGNENPSPSQKCVAPLNRSRPIVADDFRFLAGVTSVTAKVTMPTPSMYHMGHFDDVFTGVYSSREEYLAVLVSIYRAEIADLADAGCEFLQLDEVPVALLCDPNIQDMARRAGCDPEELFDDYIAATNEAIAKKPSTMKVAMHLCRGNQAGRWMGDGGYAPAADRLFNNARVSAYLMEYDTPRAGDFQPLRYLPAGKLAYLGLVSTKNPETESKDELVRRLEEASKFAPIEQLGLTTQCGFGTVGTGVNTGRPNPMTADTQRAKLERMIEVAEQVWG
jgi:5-methyltetrahydropteroyltriglutamate--homocysteine methyltransferase